MRRRHLSSVLFLLVLLIVTGSGCRDGGVTAGVATVEARQSAEEPPVPLPNRNGSSKFGVIGDFGNGSRTQFELAEQMARLRGRFGFEFVVTLGDNLLGPERPQDFQKKFELPYKPLLDAGVKFYASLGNHDSREQRYYKLFNMGGKLYYTFTPAPDIRFFMLETTYPAPEQIAWLEKELTASSHKWKIVAFHHPLYSSGDRHGSDLVLREVLEPFFLKHNVSVVLASHDHFYERVKPQKGIVYFVVGSAGQLRKGNIDRASGITARGFDTDRAFMAAEITGDEMYFNAISRLGQIVDSGVLTRRKIAP